MLAAFRLAFGGMGHEAANELRQLDAVKRRSQPDQVPLGGAGKGFEGRVAQTEPAILIKAPDNIGQGQEDARFGIGQRRGRFTRHGRAIRVRRHVIRHADPTHQLS